jgi:hypothetical protein
MPVIDFQGETIEFPDSMSNEEIEAVLQQQFQSAQEIAQPVQELPEGVMIPEQRELSPIEEEGQRFEQQQSFIKEAKEQEIIERQKRREFQELDPRTGKPLPGEGLTTGERIRDIFFTEEVIDDPDAGPISDVLGFSSILPRILGAATMQGDVASETTKLLKPAITDLNKWAASREAKNMNADQMIAMLNKSVRDAIINGTMTIDQIQGTVDAIDRIEKTKESKGFTTATSVLGNLFLEAGSDPAVLLNTAGVARNAIKGTVKRAAGRSAKEIAEKTVAETSKKMKSLGIRNNKMLEFIDAQPGATVREKLSNIRKRQPGELTPTGQIQDESIEAMFDTRTLRELDRNAEAIQGELDALKQTERQVKSRVGEKKISAKEQAEIKRRSEEFGVETEAEKAGLEAMETGEKIKSQIEEQAALDVSGVDEAISPTETVKEFTKGGKFSGRGVNKAFEEAESIAKTGKIDIPQRKKLVNELIAAAEGDVARTVDYSAVVTQLFKLRKDAPLADYKRALSTQGINPEFAESFRRIKQGNANDVIASKRQFNKVLSKEGAIDDTMKAAADNFKAAADNVIESSLGAEAYERLLTAQETGGRIGTARKKLLKAMKLDPKKTEIIEDIDFNDAVENLDSFIDDAAIKFAKEGSHPDMRQGGRFPEWKEHFGLDIEQEVKNRAKKISISGEAKESIKQTERVTEEALKKIRIDKQAAKKKISEATGGIKKKIDSLSRKTASQLQKGFSRRAAEIQKALKKAQEEADLKANVAKDFQDEVKFFAGEGGFSKNTERFKTFENKYGGKLADLIEDQAIFSIYDVSPKGKIVNAEKILDEFRGTRLPSKGLQVAALGESVVNKTYNKLKPFDKRLNSAINKIKSQNKQTARELNRIRKRGGDTEDAFRLLIEKQPLITADVLASEFKFFDALDFFDKAFIISVANSTTKEFTNREKMAAKRILARLERSGK